MPVKHMVSGIILSGLLWGEVSLPGSPFTYVALAQTSSSDGLYYLYQGQRIPLTVREDAIAVEGKTTERSGGSFSLQLRQHLQGTRGTNTDSPAEVEVDPLGETYALVGIPSAAQDNIDQLRTDIEQFEGTEAILPVLTGSDDQATLVLPNEIVVSFESNLSENQIQAILEQQNLEIIRPLRFTNNRYLVRSRSASGVEVLGAANRLYQTIGVRSATPNFIPASSNRVVDSSATDAPRFNSLSSIRPSRSAANPSVESGQPFQTDRMPLLWHLNSIPLLRCISLNTLTLDCLSNSDSEETSPLARTDMRVTEAWQQSRDGEGVVVAVIDSLIQWDHPNLRDSLYTVENPMCPGEVHGWDFSGTNPSDETLENECLLGDGDTRISTSEVSQLRGKFQDTFRLSDSGLIQRYPVRAEEVRAALKCEQQQSVCSDEQVANIIRSNIQSEVVSEFHGTAVSGVIAAQPFQGQGVVGVAPNARILPIRAGGIGSGGGTPAAIEEAIGYAASHGADVINMSLGWDNFAPFLQNVDERISEVLSTNPNLVIVVAVGNSGKFTDPAPDKIMYPASIEDVVAVGATNLKGNRSHYSNYGQGLDVVAPGGDFEVGWGLLTTGGTFISSFWEGIGVQNSAWGNSYDPRGGLIWMQGTSFSSPAIAGIFALMIGEDPERKLNRQQFVEILESTAGYESLTVTDEEMQRFNAMVEARQISPTARPEQYIFGYGLVNAEAAVEAVQEVLR
jgi:serine protease